jgi:MinD superfamily P-loop ATPase
MKIALASGKGGIGKTAVATYFVMYMAEKYSNFMDGMNCGRVFWLKNE